MVLINVVFITPVCNQSRLIYQCCYVLIYLSLKKYSQVMDLKKCIPVILTLLLTSSFLLAQDQFEEKEIGNVFHVSIPNYMTKTYNLNDVASLQFLNSSKETYVIVIEDSKEELLNAGSPFGSPQDFYSHFEQSFTDKTTLIGPVNAMQINGNSAVQVEITKPFKEYNISYLVTVIESDTHFYKMLAWTIEDYRDRYLNDFKKIAGSFRD